MCRTACCISSRVLMQLSLLRSEQLRERIVRMSVRHHEQLSQYQERERARTQDLVECTSALGQALTIIEDKGLSDSVPAFLYGIYKKHAKPDDRNGNSAEAS